MKKNKRALIISFVILIVIGLLILFVNMDSLSYLRHVNPGAHIKHTLFKHHILGVHEIKKYLISFGKWSIVILFLIYIIKPIFVVTPISVLAIVSGLIYGSIYGTIFTMIGAVLSATVGFFIARKLGQNFVNKLLKGKSTQIEGDIEKHGLSIMLFLRLAFVFPYDPLSFAAGLSKMEYKDFIIGTFIGVLPEMIAYNYLGTSMDNLISRKTLIVLIVIISFAAGSVFMKFKMNRKKV